MMTMHDDGLARKELAALLRARRSRLEPTERSYAQRLAHPSAPPKRLDDHVDSLSMWQTLVDGYEDGLAYEFWSAHRVTAPLSVANDAIRVGTLGVYSYQAVPFPTPPGLDAGRFCIQLPEDDESVSILRAIKSRA
jgi:hypothetical protein